MEIKSHYLRGNKSSALPQQIVCLSVVPISLATPHERGLYADVHAASASISWRHRGNKELKPDDATFSTAKDFWVYLDALLTTERVTWVFCHRLGTALKLLDFWGRVDNRLCDLTSTLRTDTGAHADSRTKQQNAIVCTEDPPTILRWYRPGDQATCIMVDTRNYWPDWEPTARLPQSCDHDGHYTTMVSGTNCKRLALMRAEETEQTLLRYFKFITDNDLGMFRYSIAGQSKAAFRHRWMKHNILVHQNKDARAIERKGYYGGQTECYRLGQIRGPLYKVDVNALYPWVMATHELPTIIRGLHRNDGTPKRLPPMVPLDKAICTITIATDRATYPVRRNSRVYFGRGYFKTTLSGPELCRAYNAGEIVEWHDWTYYDTDYLLRDFAVSLWKLRRTYHTNGCDLEAKWCKLLANSMYGKLAQLLPVWTELIGKKAYPRWGRQYVHWPEYKLIKSYRAIGGQLFEMTGKQEHPDAIPSIAAFITAHARERMRQLRETAGQENVMFQVCDCLLVNRDGYEILKQCESFEPEELGALRLVDTYQVVDVVGPNCYCHDGTWVSSGVSMNVIASDVNQKGWTVEVEDRIDGVIDARPDDVHRTYRRHHVKPYSNAVTNPDGTVTVPYFDDSSNLV